MQRPSGRCDARPRVGDRRHDACRPRAGLSPAITMWWTPRCKVRGGRSTPCVSRQLLVAGALRGPSSGPPDSFACQLEPSTAPFEPRMVHGSRPAETEPPYSARTMDFGCWVWLASPQVEFLRTSRGGKLRSPRRHRGAEVEDPARHSPSGDRHPVPGPRFGIVFVASSGAPAFAPSAPNPSPRGRGSICATLRDLVGLG